MVREVLRGSLTTSAGNPKRPFPNCHSKTPRSRGVGTLRVTEPLTTSLRGLWVSGNPSPGNGTERKGHHVISVRRHQKPAGPASEVVRDPVHCAARNKEEGAQGPRCAQGKGTQGPCANTEWRRGAFQAPTRLLRQLLVHEQDRRGHGSSYGRQAAVSVSRF